jgi:hypothetical protein
MSEKINEIYIKAFNQAYLLAKYKSDLIAKILESKHENEYIQGLRDGKETFELTLQNSRLKEIELLHSSRNKDKGLEI